VPHNEVGVLGVPANVRADERAEGNNVQPAGADVVKRADDESRSEPPPFERRQHLRVEQHDMVRRRAVQDFADYMLVEQQLVARLAWIVLYGDVLRASPRVAADVVHRVEPSPPVEDWVGRSPKALGESNTLHSALPCRRGALAQLGERRLCKPEVTGSIPVRSTLVGVVRTAAGIR
jgi:hypothetical protein